MKIVVRNDTEDSFLILLHVSQQNSGNLFNLNKHIFRLCPVSVNGPGDKRRFLLVSVFVLA